MTNEQLPRVSSADRNFHELLFGLLAFQTGFISQARLVAAFVSWNEKHSLTIGEILVEQGSLNNSQRELLQALTAAHLVQHGNSPQQSLAALSSVAEAKQVLAQLPEQGLDRSLRTLTILPGKLDDSATLEPRRHQASPTSPAISPGNRFRVLRHHARGGLGDVSVAVDTELNREVAFKEIQSQFADDVSSRQRFIREAEITGGLEHPSIVPVYGLGTYADGRPFYAMKFIRGDSLKEAIVAYHEMKATPGVKILALRKLLQRFIDVCEAIQYAHDRGILHRDLKPGNIMLGRYGETLVVDWGLAKPLNANEARASPVTPISVRNDSGATLPGTAVGTPQYMSPEQAAGDLDKLGPASDVYGLGATLYHLLVGSPPFEGKVVDVLIRVVEGNFTRPCARNPQIPPALEAICRKAMALKPLDRYGNAQALANDVEHWMADEPVTAFRMPLTEYAVRWGRQHIALVTILMVFTSSFIVVGIPVLFLAKNWRVVNSVLLETLQVQPDPTSMLASMIQDLKNPFALLNATNSLKNTQSDPTVVAYERARAFAKIGSFAEAEAEIQRAITLNPQNFNSCHLYGWILLAMQKPQDALSQFQKAIEGKSTAPGLWVGRALCYIDQNEDRDALEDLDYAIELQPTLKVAYRTRIKVYERQGNNAAASADRRLLTMLEKGE